jgi:hypothetical protein
MPGRAPGSRDPTSNAHLRVMAPHRHVRTVLSVVRDSVRQRYRRPAAHVRTALMWNRPSRGTATRRDAGGRVVVRRTALCAMPSRELVTVSSQQRLLVPAALLVAVQAVHAVLPGPAEGGGSVVGRVEGVLLLVAAVAALGEDLAAAPVGAPAVAVDRRTGRGRVPALPRPTGQQPVDVSLLGRRDVGWIQWLPVLAAIMVGVWCAVAGAARQTGDSA